MSRNALGILAVIILSTQANAAVTVTNSTNITLANSQTEIGDDFSDNPNVVNAPVGPLIAYTATANTCCGSDHDTSWLNDGDIGTGISSSGNYTLPDIPGDLLTLNFGGPAKLGSVAIYNGYLNRDDGDYLLRDGSGNILGGWRIHTPHIIGTNDGADSFWLVFNTPVITSMLTIQSDFTDESASFREVQVFGAVPEPASWAMLIAGFGLVGATQRRRRSVAVAA